MADGRFTTAKATSEPTKSKTRRQNGGSNDPFEELARENRESHERIERTLEDAQKIADRSRNRDPAPEVTPN